MTELTTLSVSHLPEILTILVILQSLFLFVALILFRKFNGRNDALSKELSSQIHRIEMLTATRRQQMLKHYDRILGKLTVRIPTTVAGHLGKTIFETESRILKRLAELEPHCQRNDSSRKKLDELILAMENLESALVSLTAEAVKSVMLESRADLLKDEIFLEEHLAA